MLAQDHELLGEGNDELTLSRDEQALKSVPLFATFRDRDIVALASVARTVCFPAETTICTEGQRGIGLQLILDGTVEVTSSGTEPVERGSGAYFGELAMIDGGPRRETIRATSQVTTLSIIAWEFTEFLDSHPGVAKQVLFDVLRRLRSGDQTASY